MRPIKHLLAVIDPQGQAQPCVAKGARLARATNATLHLLACAYPPPLSSSRFTHDEVLYTAMARHRDDLDEQLQLLAAPLRKSGLDVRTNVSFRESLHLGILSEAEARGADLVIKDTHYHPAALRAFFTSTDWHLIRECPVPLLLTKPLAWSARPKFAAALDPAHVDDKPGVLDRDLLDAAADLSAWLQGEAFAVHAFDALPVVTGIATAANALVGDAFGDMGKVLETLRQHHAREFRSLLAGRTAFEGRADLIDGAPVTALPDYVARMAIDVLVAGAVSRAGPRRLLLGSTAERLLDRLPCDILIIKPAPAQEN